MLHYLNNKLKKNTIGTSVQNEVKIHKGNRSKQYILLVNSIRL